jgi:hypothetical protein
MKNRVQYKLLILTVLYVMPIIGYSKIVYVMDKAIGSNNGSSWTNAFIDLQTAIDSSAIGDEIWVCGGKYFPSKRVNGNTKRNATFHINKNISVFGGFSGTPGSEGDFSQRNTTNIITILSGDIGVPDDASDNSHHVITIENCTMMIDGFIITEGKAEEGSGSGIFIKGEFTPVTATIRNCILTDHQNINSGGAIAIMYDVDGTNIIIDKSGIFENSSNGGSGIVAVGNSGAKANLLVSNTKFMSNHSIQNGGSCLQVITHSSELKFALVNCMLTGNASPSGHAIEFFTTGTAKVDASIINSTIVGNTSGLSVVDVGNKNTKVKIRNTIFFNNGSGQGIRESHSGLIEASHSVIPFGFPGTQMLGLDPQFENMPDFNSAPHSLGDVHLKATSEAIDGGSNNFFPLQLSTDLDGNPRFIRNGTDDPGIIDIGCFERFIQSTSVENINNVDISIIPNPTSDFLAVKSHQNHDLFDVSFHEINGKLLFKTKTTNEAPIDISHIKSGIYLIAIKGDKIQYSQFIIVQ